MSHGRGSRIRASVLHTSMCDVDADLLTADERGDLERSSPLGKLVFKWVLPVLRAGVRLDCLECWRVIVFF